MVLPYMDINQPRVYMCSPYWTLLLPPFLSHLSGSTQYTSPEHPVSCIEPVWRSVSHMVIYMLQFYSLKLSHPCLLPQSPEVCCLHLCLFCCLTYRVIVTIFLNSMYIYIIILYWCFSFWLTSLCVIGSSFIHLIRTDSSAFLLITE